MKEQIKPELNNESKARFFAQYYGQFVAVQFDNRDTYDVTYHTLNDIRYDYLKLTSLFSVTDEDYTELMMKKYQSQPWSAFKRPNLIPEIFNQEQTDYIRSKGYAIPWMGLTVEDLVNAGWVKLKGGNNGD